jgi:rhamnogalacturonan endolyase
VHYIGFFFSPATKMHLATITFAVLSLWTTATSAAFGLSQDSSYFTVDAGSTNSLVYKVSRSTCDITSILYRGIELQNNNPYSHINSGLGSGTSVSGTTIGGP